MVKLEDSIIARFESHGHRFEILIDPVLVDLIKEMKEVDVLDYMVSDTIFKDANKGDRASEEVLKEVFATDNIQEIVKHIILKGQVQLTTEQRRKMLEDKKRQIIMEIAKNAINPQTNAPHPPQRIETAIEEAKVHIDPFKSVEEQVNTVVKAIRLILPIKFEKIKIAVKLSGEDYLKSYQELTKMGTLLKEEWQNDGSWVGVIEIPAGIQIEFFDLINKKTHGNAQTKILKS